ncbi:hypothetical protein [Mucilaginibacter auburnensis]|uniref:Uncharacterized protein n=1 Tax=Mucilaginibacter auburnensis TaxID=1457233 RepID=A0A2H9VNR0_9SPHI|nr:hypothetical protein [Mucilaginibacter auburnensis]PJJ79950.1 hypothetical protein CLV57_3089 [Mucilaginibacter auburnensis]
MNDLILYFIAGGFVVTAIIVFNHKKQKNKLNAFVMEAEKAPSLLMIQSVERKLNNIYGSLYDNGVRTEGEPNGKKLQLIQELETLETAYADKKIGLRDYNDRLQQLQLKTSKL